jgi:branched-subunit amino acid transport protein
MTAVWVTIGALAVTTALIRASGPVILGGRDLPPRLIDVIALLAPALLAALVVVETFGGPDRTLELDSRMAGVAAAGGVLALRGSMLWAVATAAVVAAVVRALT